MAKAGIALALLAALAFAVNVMQKRAFDSGYNKAQAEYAATLEIAKEEAIAEARRAWEETNEISEIQINVERRIAEGTRIVEREVPRVVERIVEVAPNCADLGDDVPRLLNDAIAAAAAENLPSNPR